MSDDTAGRDNAPGVLGGDEVKAAQIRAALAEATAGYRSRRKPTEVTADRLADHLEKHYDTTDGSLRDAIAVVRAWLEEL